MILFIDDESRLMDSYRRELELSNYNVTFISKVDAALDFFNENKDDIKLVILDLMMSPGKSFTLEETGDGARTGISIFNCLRREKPKLPVVIFTNVSADDVREFFHNKEDCLFLRKEDYLPYQLGEEVGKMLSKKQEGKDE